MANAENDAPSVDPFADPPAGERADSLDCTRNVTLTLGKEALIVIDENHTTEARFCGLIPQKTVPTRSISYFHVLWAEQSGTNILIRYAASKSSSVLRPETIEYPLEKPSGTEVAPWIEHLLDRAYGASQRRKRIKVLVNPFGGQGAAQKLYTRDIEPIFAAARCEVDVERTQHSGHAVEIAEGLDVDNWDVVACCSGDGVPHEVFNGLGKRKDARRALARIAVAQMPCGSGNAMSWNLYGTGSCSLAALSVLKGFRRPLDLVSITQGDRRILSVLSQSVGIVAESDLGTDHLRWMGDFRFTWGFLVRVFGKNVYPCDIAACVEVADKPAVRDAYQRGLEEAATRSPESVGPEDSGLPPLRFGTSNDPLPEGWTLVPHDTLGNFYAGNMAYMAANMSFFPAALPTDGRLDVLRIDGLVKRRTALKMMLAIEKGKFFGMEDVNYQKLSGYRIIPKGQKDGYISIDGERIPFEPYQAEVHKGLGTVLMRSANGGYEAPGPGSN